MNTAAEPAETLPGVVNIMVALPDEARPLIECYALVRTSQGEPFRVYENPGRGLRLIVTGLGKMTAAAAAGYLFALGGNRRDEAWLNAGIAGHRDLPLGTPCLAHEVVDRASETSWYLPSVLDVACPTDRIYCVDQPETVYADGGLYDMESAGVVATCTRFAASELVQFVKIVSDNRDSPVAEPPRTRRAKCRAGKMVREFVDDQLTVIDEVVGALRTLSAQRQRQSASPPKRIGSL
jgi:nucleoside phosphorylase